jgi:hypothetical protein
MSTGKFATAVLLTLLVWWSSLQRQVPAIEPLPQAEANLSGAQMASL